jgi:chaperonin cofactor prefoldin
MIAGPANFPVKKKQKQIAAWEANRKNYISLDDARYKLRYILLQEHPINIGDPDAIEKLTKKLERLEANHAALKEATAKAQKEFNAELKAGTIKLVKHYYGCHIPEGFTEEDRNNPEMIKNLSEWEQRAMVGTLYMKDGKPVNKPSLGYRSSNTSQERARLQKRIEELKRQKEAPKTEETGDGWTMYEDTDAARVCFEFDGKPEPDIISTLKSNGFKWAPSMKRWQRQNTDNGRRAAERVKAELTA